MTRPVLTARWEHVVLVSYRVPSELLMPHLPPGIELDTLDEAPEAGLVSVVALRFRALRVHRVPIPTAQDFGEVNLRFYVRRATDHGSVFLREYVSHPLVIAGARLFYGEPYRRARIRHDAVRDASTMRVETSFARGDRSGRIQLVADADACVPDPGSIEHWLKERYWGFGRGRDGGTVRYRVTHPVWPIHRVRDASLGVDPGLLMGGGWGEIDWARQWHSTVVAAGSPAAIYPAETLT
jgi:uncharacterized protein